METNNWYIRGKNNYGELVRQELVKRGATMDADSYNYDDKDCVFFVVLGIVICKFAQSASGKYITKNWKEVKVGEAKPKPQFKPFDRVLACDGEDCHWGIDLYERYDEDEEGYIYRCMSCYYKYCIPYEGNENLVGLMFDPKHIEGYDE